MTTYERLTRDALAPGKLVRAREREWVVAHNEPRDPANLVRLRPLGGGLEDQIAMLSDGPELITDAALDLPDPERGIGNHLAGKLMWEASRLASRSATGPLLSLSRIGVEPRPYQFVPLMMALQQTPTRLLIADDVGVGKTIEACLIARELWDRREIEGMTVLCPPALASQWVRTLKEQFHLDAVAVLPSTVRRLEADATSEDNLFGHYPVTVVSLDYIKSDRRRNIFINHCPGLVIVDEAHTCADNGSGQTQRRYQLLRELVNPEHPKGKNRHMLLVTATPHTGSQHAFFSLLKLLDPTKFEGIPVELLSPPTQDSPQLTLTKDEQAQWKRQLEAHFVQRRRADLERFLKADTPFPRRETALCSATRSEASRQLMGDVLSLCRDATEAVGLSTRELHLRYWSALSLLRAVSSSPAAAVLALKSRAQFAGVEAVEELDSAAQQVAYDPADQEASDLDVGAQALLDVAQGAAKARLDALIAQAEALRGPERDLKLKAAIEQTRDLIERGWSPILFCRFISTVEYVADALRVALRGVQVIDITGDLPPEDREARVAAIDDAQRRVLVCTDCLSEGINLQHIFDAVIHYDLAWTPTRHEQREGRVDRYEQPRDVVRVLTLYVGANPVDQYVRQVLRDRREEIIRATGITAGEDGSFDAIERSLKTLFRQEQAGQLEATQGELIGTQTVEYKPVDPLRSQPLFTQSTLQQSLEPRIQQLIAQTRRAMGTSEDALAFLDDALPALGALVSQLPDGVREVDTIAMMRGVVGAILPYGWRRRFKVGPKRADDVSRVVRTHPLVTRVASYIMEAAIDPNHDQTLPNPARRLAVVRTAGVATRTHAAVIRARYRVSFEASRRHDLIVDDVLVVAFEGALVAGQSVTLLPQDQAERLLTLTPSGNVPPGLASQYLAPYADVMARASLRSAVTAWLRGPRQAELEEQYRSILELRVLGEQGRHRQLARQLTVEPLMDREVASFDLLAVCVFLPSITL
jgi:superfamily II DNA or RNA helicase